MVEEISAGGVVIFGNTILLLRKFNGDWVLPKGRVENGEDIPQTALREVLEESGVKAKIISYLGKVNYTYKNIQGNKKIYKTVHWYLMKTNSMDSVPLKTEGFKEAKFIHKDKVLGLMRHKDEKKILNRALKINLLD